MPERKIPQIADADVINEVAALRIDRGDPRGAIQHVGPLGLLVPMQLAHAAGIQPHVHAGDALGDAELAYRHLARPAAALLPHVRVGKGEAQVGQGAVIGGRRIEHVGILLLAQPVARPRIRPADAGFAARLDLVRNSALGAEDRAAGDGSAGQHLASRWDRHGFLHRVKGAASSRRRERSRLTRSKGALQSFETLSVEENKRDPSGPQLDSPIVAFPRPCIRHRQPAMSVSRSSAIVQNLQHSTVISRNKYAIRPGRVGRPCAERVAFDLQPR